MAKTNWNVDKAHSTVDFSVKHMMFATVKGGFQDFDATIVADPTDLTTADIEFTVDVASIDTRSSDRDAHLRSADFFDVDNHPKMTFKSTKISKTDDNEYDVAGDLTVRGTTKSETFSVTFEGTGLDPWGNEKAGFGVAGKIKRSDYGLTWNAPLEAGGVLVGDQIKIELQLQAAKG
ncbi:YceI family protein [Sutcliffiella halmapala]|uniref:YceI family protein n=1 Tax=Sutcliffiella halmapala TaxID=79882 RepID=UPI0009949560|nr:YceI family protein [Sutcliffiella halmapala]